MKNKFITRLVQYFVVLLLFLQAPADIFAQSVKRQCISAYGASSSNEKVSFFSTAGQTYSTKTFCDTECGLKPGFQQPLNFKANIIETDFAVEIDVFPNPASEKVYFSTSENIESIMISVYDISGKLIFNDFSDDFSQYALDCKEYKNGVYFINISSGVKKQVSKLIISK